MDSKNIFSCFFEIRAKSFNVSKFFEFDKKWRKSFFWSSTYLTFFDWLALKKWIFKQICKILPKMNLKVSF